MLPIPTVLSSHVDGFRGQNTAMKGPLKGLLPGDPTAALKARRLKLASWRGLGLRQSFADEAFMLGHLKAAGLRSPNRMEPATVRRLRTYLHRAGVLAAEQEASLGTNLAGYINRNADLPLWAAVALVLEATGRFKPPVGTATA